MKPRRVVVEIEIDTDISTKDLTSHYRQPDYFPTLGKYVDPIQVSVNVIRVPEPKKSAKKRS